MYQKRILPYFIIPSTFLPQAYSLLERYGQTEGQTNNYGVDGRLNEQMIGTQSLSMVSA
jgi:hypothetical protein